jgi:hypothetical protein
MIRHSRNTRRTRQDGIALVVIAALFVAFSVIAAIAVERNTTTQLITRRDSAAAQLQRISNAIIEYSVFNQVGGKLVYPCPARPDLASTDANFGVSVNTASTQDCNVTNHTGITLLGTDVIRGMVPIQSLSQYGLGVNDAFDPWNNRIMYVVNRQMTLGGSSTNTNNPTVTDPITSQAYLAPDFIVVSYGRDGVGATRRESTTISIACTDGTTKRRFENCDADTAFVLTPSFTAATAGDLTYFDDVLSFTRQ